MKWSPQPYLIKLNFLHYNSTLFIVEKGEPNSSNEIVAMTIYMTVIVVAMRALSLIAREGAALGLYKA